MDLTLQNPGDHLFIRAISDEGIQIGEDWYNEPLIVSTQKMIRGWTLYDQGKISKSLLNPVLDLEPDILLLGTGDKQCFPLAENLIPFYGRGIGVEVMTTPAACRTFNVLALEERRVVAALLPIGA